MQSIDDMLRQAAPRETILVIDDDVWVRRIAIRALGAEGYEMLEASDGQTALVVAESHPGPIHLVLSDAIMPGMTGAQAVDALRVERPTLKAVFMSGYHADELSSWGIDAAHEVFVQKPFIAADLAVTIRMMLDVVAPPATAAPDEATELRQLIAHPARLARLRETGLLDAASQDGFDRLTRLAARFLSAPTAVLSLIDESRDFHLSQWGVGEPAASRRGVSGSTLCQQALRSPEALVLPDVRAHPVFGSVPSVVAHGVGAYLGIPLRMEGHTIGVLCVADSIPRNWSGEQIGVLGDLAAMTLDEIELRMSVRRHAESRAALGRTNAQLHLAKSAAEASNRAKSEFLAHMSHELRTPLNSIIGFANILRRNIAKPMTPREADYAERISANGGHLLDVVNRILDLSKVEQGSLALNCTWVALDELARSICCDFSVQAETAGVSLAMEVECGGWQVLPLAPIHTDAGKLRQVLVNLVGNALKFTPAGGYVRVVIGCADGSGEPQRLDVRDSGIGIAPSAQARVFEAFEQAEPDTGAKYGGTGLGLRISRALCEALGFRLSLESEVGVGSTFSVRLERGR
jgi:signal transduction histidine kinase